jgi:hypothetical protein
MYTTHAHLESGALPRAKAASNCMYACRCSSCFSFNRSISSSSSLACSHRGGVPSALSERSPGSDQPTKPTCVSVVHRAALCGTWIHRSTQRYHAASTHLCYCSASSCSAVKHAQATAATAALSSLLWCHRMMCMVLSTIQASVSCCSGNMPHGAFLILHACCRSPNSTACHSCSWQVPDMAQR